MADEQQPLPRPGPLLDSEREAERAKLARTRWFGALLIPLSLGWTWYFLWQPLVEAQRTGQIEYSIKAVMMGPVFVYLGVALLVADLRDGQISTRDECGRKHYTRKGWLFLAGVVAVCGLTLACWTAALHHLGFAAFG